MKTLARNPAPLFAAPGPQPVPANMKKRRAYAFVWPGRLFDDLSVKVFTEPDHLGTVQRYFGDDNIHTVAVVDAMLGTREALANAAWRAAFEAVADGRIAPRHVPLWDLGMATAIDSGAVPRDLVRKVEDMRDRARRVGAYAPPDMTWDDLAEIGSAERPAESVLTDAAASALAAHGAAAYGSAPDPGLLPLADPATGEVDLDGTARAIGRAFAPEAASGTRHGSRARWSAFAAGEPPAASGAGA